MEHRQAMVIIRTSRMIHKNQGVISREDYHDHINSWYDLLADAIHTISGDYVRFDGPEDILRKAPL